MDPKFNFLASELRQRYGKKIRQILFFGSRVRGDATKESDYDCLLVFDEVTGDLKMDLDKLAANWLLNQGIVFAGIAVSEADLQRLSYEPFLQNARLEGLAA